MKKQQASGLLLLCALISLTGCYNNTHLRTQRLLEPGEQAISGSGVLALVGDEPTYVDLDNTGVAGLRGELSLLRGTNWGEVGPYIGLGLADVSVFDMIAGFDIRRYTGISNDIPMKLGLQGEMNLTPGDTLGGLAFQIRPSLISASSPSRPFYGGLHGLVSMGKLHEYASWREHVGVDEYGRTIYNWYEDKVGYRFLGFGGGITLGWEKFFQTTSIQFQLDASMVRGHFYSSEYTPDTELHSFAPAPPPSTSIFMVAVSVGINSFKPRSSQTRSYHPYPASPLRPEEVLQATASGEPPQRYDPGMGLPLTGRPDTTARLRFDPATGLPLEAEAEAPAPLRFDPETGVLQVETPDTSVIPRFDPETGLPVTAEPGESRPQFNPETGELIAPVSTETEPIDIARSPAFSETTLRIMAQNRAERDYNTTASILAGGLASCSGIGVGSLVLGGLFGFPGFLIGAGTGGVIAAELYINDALTSIPIPENLESAGPEVHETYRQLYQVEVKRVKRANITEGIADCALITAAAIPLIIVLL